MSAQSDFGARESDPSWIDGPYPTPRTVRRRSDVPTPAFVLARDGLTSEFEDGSCDNIPRLMVMAPPVMWTASKYWFNPSWINDDFVPCADHGEFDSPVWLAAKLAMHVDRKLDDGCQEEAEALHIPGTVHGDRGGQLRSLLHCIATATTLAPLSRSARPHPPKRRESANRPWAGDRNHCLPSPDSSQVRKFVRFVSNNVRKVSVNTD